MIDEKAFTVNDKRRTVVMIVAVVTLTNEPLNHFCMVITIGNDQRGRRDSNPQPLA